MDPVKMKFALALWLSLGFAVVGPVSAQSVNAASDLSGIVDGVRGRCGLGLLARTTSSQTCQGFKDYGSRMQCVANDLGDEVRVKDAPALADVARCYRRLGDALVAGRGASTDQVNALEDICHNLRHETLVSRSPVARDALILASNALMPDFSRKTVSLPTSDPMMGIRLHDLPECVVAFAQPPGPPATAGTPGPSRVARAANGGMNGVSTSAVEPVRIVSLAPTPGVELVPPVPAKVGAAVLAEGQGTGVKPGGPADMRPGAGGSESVVEPVAGKVADLAAGKTKSRSSVSELNASGPISESAVISALPAVSSGTRKSSRRSIARGERNTAGYGVAASDARTRSPARTAVAVPPELESKTSSRSSGSGTTNSGYSAATPPPLPLTGPPLRPQTYGSVR